MTPHEMNHDKMVFVFFWQRDFIGQCAIVVFSENILRAQAAIQPYLMIGGTSYFCYRSIPGAEFSLVANPEGIKSRRY